MSSFQRARQPEQREQRRQELLAAANALLAEGGLDAVTLSAIARAAGLAKSNVYRYFASREEILLEILIEDERIWVDDLERALVRLAGTDDVDAVAALVAKTIVARPITCELTSVLAGVLERNLSQEATAEFKGRVVALSIRIRNALHAALPGLPHEHTEALLRYLHALVAGLWPMSRPAPPLAKLLARPELRSLRTQLEPDLRGAFGAMLRGLISAAR